MQKPNIPLNSSWLDIETGKMCKFNGKEWVEVKNTILDIEGESPDISEDFDIEDIKNIKIDDKR